MKECEVLICRLVMLQSCYLDTKKYRVGNFISLEEARVVIALGPQTEIYIAALQFYTVDQVGKCCGPSKPQSRQHSVFENFHRLQLIVKSSQDFMRGWMIFPFKMFNIEVVWQFSLIVCIGSLNSLNTFTQTSFE